MATVFGVTSLISLIVVIFFTYKRGGDAKAAYGFTGVFATFFSLIGTILGFVSVRDKNSFRLFPVLGLILNVIVLSGIGGIIFLGVNG